MAPIIGPPLGGFITRYASWHWIFFINVPLGLIAIALSLRIIPAIREEERRPFDLPGFFATSVAMVSLVSAMELLGDTRPQGWATLLLLGLGTGCMLFALRHFRRAEWPMVRLDALQVPTFRVDVRRVAFPCFHQRRSLSVAAAVSGRLWYGSFPFRAAGAGGVCRQLHH